MKKAHNSTSIELAKSDKEIKKIERSFRRIEYLSRLARAFLRTSQVLGEPVEELITDALGYAKFLREKKMKGV